MEMPSKAITVETIDTKDPALDVLFLFKQIIKQYNLTPVQVALILRYLLQENKLKE